MTCDCVPPSPALEMGTVFNFELAPASCLHTPSTSRLLRFILYYGTTYLFVGASSCCAQGERSLIQPTVSWKCGETVGTTLVCCAHETHVLLDLVTN